jgi:hypothetical protein
MFGQMRTTPTVPEVSREQEEGVNDCEVPGSSHRAFRVEIQQKHCFVLLREVVFVLRAAQNFFEVQDT